MEYLTKGELRNLFTVAHAQSQRHHLAMLVGLWHGARVSEVVALTSDDVFNGRVTLDRLKGSERTCQPLHIDIDPLFDESPLLTLKGKLFPFTRQTVDLFMKKYGAIANIHPDKRHFHVLKHSCAILLWDETKSLGQIQSYLGHKSAGSTLIYLREADATKAQQIVLGMKI